MSVTYVQVSYVDVLLALLSQLRLSA